MSDEKQTHPEEDLSLDDILSEVSAWSEDAAPPGEPALQTEGPDDAPPEEDADEAPDTPPHGANIVVLNPGLRPIDDEEDDDGEDPADADEAPEDAADAPIPNNLIVFTPPEGAVPPEVEEEPPPPPETIREAAVLAAARAMHWAGQQKERMQHPQRDKEEPAQGKPEKPRKPARPAPPPPPDTPPRDLVNLYSNGLSALRWQTMGAFLCSILLLLLAFVAGNALPLPDDWKDPVLLTWISVVPFALCLLCAHTLLQAGVLDLLHLHPGMHSIATLAALFALADTFTMQLLHLRTHSLPLLAPICLVLSFQLWGKYSKQRQMRINCRTAASAAAPDLMTAEPSQWNGKPVYRRRFGSITGFGSAVQEADGAERHFARIAPFLLLLALLFALLIALLGKKPQLLLWALSAMLTAAATLSGCLCFSLPFSSLSRRFSTLGVALAGWPGISSTKHGAGLLVEDSDLFPPGSVKLVSYRVFGGFDPAKVISVTASLLRAAGFGLDPVFHALMRSDGGTFVTATELDLQNEGISAHVGGEPVLVGTLSHLARMGVNIPAGVRVKTGLFCAIDNRFAGQFILDYKLHKSASAAMDMLLGSRITPVLIALDFNLVPAVLRRQFRFPWDKMAFPEISQRAKMQKAPVPRESRLMALLCLQGLAPVATVATGSQRLQTAVRLCAVLTSLGAFLGILITAYLSAAAAFSSLTPWGMTLFLISWFLPTLLISGWVNQF